MLPSFLVAWNVFPDWFGGEYFRFNILLAALGTLVLWVALVVFFSWLLSACGSLNRMIRKNYRESSVQWENVPANVKRVTSVQ